MHRFLCALILAAALAQPVLAQQTSAIEVVEPWARATAGAAKTGAAYMTLRNAANSSDRLVGVSTPVAGRAEMHTHIKEGDVMRMRKVGGIEVKSKGEAMLAPGGLHLMFFDLKRPLKEGDQFPVTLRFERAGEVTAQVVVRPATASSAADHPHKTH